jgi:hypothetical protein
VKESPEYDYDRNMPPPGSGLRYSPPYDPDKTPEQNAADFARYVAWWQKALEKAWAKYEAAQRAETGVYAGRRATVQIIEAREARERQRNKEAADANRELHPEANPRLTEAEQQQLEFQVRLDKYKELLAECRKERYDLLRKLSQAKQAAARSGGGKNPSQVAVVVAAARTEEQAACSVSTAAAVAAVMTAAIRLVTVTVNDVTHPLYLVMTGSDAAAIAAAEAAAGSGTGAVTQVFTNANGDALWA